MKAVTGVEEQVVEKCLLNKKIYMYMNVSVILSRLTKKETTFWMSSPPYLVNLMTEPNEAKMSNVQNAWQTLFLSAFIFYTAV